MEHGRKTVPCVSCTRPLELRDLRASYLGPSLDEAREVAGLQNARLAGRAEEFLASQVVTPSREARHDNKWNAAAAAARRATGETARADAVARALGEFEDAELAVAFELAGLRAPGRHLQRMIAAQIVHEPRPGVYRAMG